MKAHKSIVNYAQLIQQQVMELVKCPELKGKLALGPTQDFQWQQLNCIVPLTLSSFKQNNLTSIKILLRFCKQKPWTIPGVYVESIHIPQQVWYLNITEDMLWRQINVPIKEIVLRVIKQISDNGLLNWGKYIYQSHFYNNKMQNNLINQVNQSKPQKKNNTINFNQNIQPSSYTFSNFSKFIDNSTKNQQQKNNNISMNMNININHINQIKLQNNYNIKQKQNKLNDCKQENQQIQQNQVKYVKQQKMEMQKTNLDQSRNGQHSANLNIHINLKKQDLIENKNQMLFLSPFSCFKPISQIVSKQNNNNEFRFCKSQEVSGVKKQQKTGYGFNGFIGSGFLPVRMPKSDISYLSQNLVKNQNQLSENIKCQGESINSCFDSNTKAKGSKHPKPMNKNANLPKFLIRIFIKYVDKFKSMYVKKQYDKLYTQCKKMKEWKKNDRRQHAFGLKHLKTFFQDYIQGFPQPALNRKVISRIIDNFLLQQICQNSQIPQSHRVGYLIACRVYSIRCRNASLAGRIQSK